MATVQISETTTPTNAIPFLYFFISFILYFILAQFPFFSPNEAKADSSERKGDFRTGVGRSRMAGEAKKIKIKKKYLVQLEGRRGGKLVS